MSKVYNAFLFFNELDVLDMHLNIMDEFVDLFIIAESTVTHSGKPKPLYFEENQSRFEKFKKKILYKVVDSTPNDFSKIVRCYEGSITNYVLDSKIFENDNSAHLAYGREFWQRECLRTELDLLCEGGDIIILSDVDEIVRPEAVVGIKNVLEEMPEAVCELSMDCYYYYLNLLKERDWKATKAFTYRSIANASLGDMRYRSGITIKNAGWHFSFLGGADSVKEKIQSYSHCDLATDENLNAIDGRINTLTDPFGRGELTKVVINDTFPKYLLENIDKLKYMILNETNNI